LTNVVRGFPQAFRERKLYRLQQFNSSYFFTIITIRRYKTQGVEMSPYINKESNNSVVLTIAK